MNDSRPSKQIFNEIQAYYDSIPSPKYRHADLDTLKEKFELLQGLKDDLGHDKAYAKLGQRHVPGHRQVGRIEQTCQHAQRPDLVESI